MGFGGAKQQVPSPWGGKQFKHNGQMTLVELYVRGPLPVLLILLQAPHTHRDLIQAKLLSLLQKYLFYIIGGNWNALSNHYIPLSRVSTQGSMWSG